MAIQSVLIANRGEIAVRIVRAAQELGVATAVVFAEDDAGTLACRLADQAVALSGAGPSPYLDLDQLVAAATTTGADALHPGYGFLAERADLARACAAAGVTFVGPRPETLDRFGDKTAARRLAVGCGIPVVPGSDGPVDPAGAAAFFDRLEPGQAVVLKAVAGGGGRGMRVVHTREELVEAHARCASEAMAAFGQAEVYAELALERPRHVEVQVVGDGSGAVVALGDRDCTLQRRYQKVVELAPAPGLPPGLRRDLTDAALQLAATERFLGVGTVEFLVTDDGRWYFMEVNARLQVEHTVTEQVTGVDLVQTQLLVAGGTSLAELGWPPGSAPPARGAAVQVRVNLETFDAAGTLKPTGGTLTAFTPPAGPGVRVDTYAEAGLTTSPRFDPLLAKVIATVPSGVGVGTLLAKAERTLAELVVRGVVTNTPFLRAVLTHPDVAAGRIHTRWIDEHLAELAAAGIALEEAAPKGGQPFSEVPLGAVSTGPAAVPPMRAVGLAAGHVGVTAPIQGTVVSFSVAPHDLVAAGQPLLVMEAMKMEHEVHAPRSGRVDAFSVTIGEAVFEGHVLVHLEPAEVDATATAAEAPPDLDHIRPDLAEIVDRHSRNEDAARPEAVARRRAAGRRTARENVADLCDAGTFVEYGALVLAAQRQRRSLDELIAKTPADGMVIGIGRINGDQFGDDGRCVVLSYDYTVFAGTQGNQNHRKKDRLFELANQHRLPVVAFAEGGGGRPGETEGLNVAGLDCMAFYYFAKLSGLVPLVGITTGFCFAGNASLLGCCDVVIATRDSNIGMGGPAMIEGGGLGVFAPEEVGPLDVQARNGVVDLVVEDEAEAVAAAKRYLGYFQGDDQSWSCADQRLLRHAIPANRLRVYDVRRVIETLCDTGSVLELRRDFGVGMITALARIEGRAVGVVANDPTHLAGAIDPDDADKEARFLQLCDAFDLPVLFLCDTPGFMVGPEVERAAQVRHACRLFLIGASLSVPFFTIVLRKGYGLGAQGMAGGSFKAGLFCISWPSGEFGGMGLEGAVTLGYRNELAAIEDPAEREETYRAMVDRMYEKGKALNFATHFEIDEVIDPRDSRHWITTGLAAAGRAPHWSTRPKKRPCIDAW